ncbi:solute carrier family 35 member B1 homolog [Chironomus tepperi]|uniref:solute carrier family 35 member B1 homolog n=1 Tax=Chironomus tepperi TaxID=113505 RepID=UPI00391F9768
MGKCMDSVKGCWANDTLRMVTFAVGIIVCFSMYGMLQEKIMRVCYGGEFVDGVCNGKKFEFELTLVLIYCIWYSIFSKILMYANNRIPFVENLREDKTFVGWYIAVAFCYLSAMVCSTMALRWINYPTQVITKSSKPIPVMILGVFLAQKRYTIQKYFFVLQIVVGVSLFVYKEGKAKPGEENSWLGLALIGMSLLADGVLGGIEDRIRNRTNPSALSIMFALNFWASIILIVSVIATMEIFKFYEFVMEFPEVLMKIVSASLIGSLGQIFIFLMIAGFGSLPCSIATTTRKFFNVLISVFLFGNSLIPRQWIATGIVFTALLADALFGNKKIFRRKGEDVQVVSTTNDFEFTNVKLEEIEKLNQNKEQV